MLFFSITEQRGKTYLIVKDKDINFLHITESISPESLTWGSTVYLPMETDGRFFLFTHQQLIGIKPVLKKVDRTLVGTVPYNSDYVLRGGLL